MRSVVFIAGIDNEERQKPPVLLAPVMDAVEVKLTRCR